MLTKSALYFKLGRYAIIFEDSVIWTLTFYWKDKVIILIYNHILWFCSLKTTNKTWSILLVVFINCYILACCDSCRKSWTRLSDWTELNWTDAHKYFEVKYLMCLKYSLCLCNIFSFTNIKACSSPGNTMVELITDHWFALISLLLGNLPDLLTFLNSLVTLFWIYILCLQFDLQVQLTFL